VLRGTNALQPTGDKKNYLTIQRDMGARKHCPGYKKLREEKNIFMFVEL